MNWFSRKKPISQERRGDPQGHHFETQLTEPKVAPPDPGLPDDNLTQRMFGMLRACGMSLVVHGPGSAEECFAAAAAVAPALTGSFEVGGGLGAMHSAAHPWMIAAGPSDALLACFLTPDADIRFFTEEVSDRLNKIGPPWRLSTVMHIDDTWPQTVARRFADASALPMWTLRRFAQLRPEQPHTRPASSSRTGALRPATRSAVFGNLWGAEFTFVEHIRHNPPDGSYDTFERVEELGRLLQDQRGGGYEYTVRDPEGRRLDPDWLSTRSLAHLPSGDVFSASHLNHSALRRSPARDLGAIDMRKLNTWRGNGRADGLVSPHHSLYRGDYRRQAHLPIRMVANAVSVDLHGDGNGAVVESWGGSAGAVAIIDDQQEYRHLTFLDGLSGAESIEISPDGKWLFVDGGSRAWLVEIGTGRWMPSPIANAGWYPGRDSCLLTFGPSDPLTPTVFNLATNAYVHQFPALLFSQRSSNVDFLDRAWSPRVSSDGRRLLVLTPAGVPAEFQREHGTGNRVGMVELINGYCELVTSIFIDPNGELERDHVEARWNDDRWHGTVRLHPELAAQLRDPAPLSPERNDPEWLAADPRQLAGLALEALVEQFQSDPHDTEAVQLMAEVILGVTTTARLNRPSWDAVADWASNIADFMRKPVANGWLDQPNQDAWRSYIATVEELQAPQF